MHPELFCSELIRQNDLKQFFQYKINGKFQFTGPVFSGSAQS